MPFLYKSTERPTKYTIASHSHTVHSNKQQENLQFSLEAYPIYENKFINIFSGNVLTFSLTLV